MAEWWRQGVFLGRPASGVRSMPSVVLWLRAHARARARYSCRHTPSPFLIFCRRLVAVRSLSGKNSRFAERHIFSLAIWLVWPRLKVPIINLKIYVPLVSSFSTIDHTLLGQFRLAYWKNAFMTSSRNQFSACSNICHRVNSNSVASVTFTPENFAESSHSRRCTDSNLPRSITYLKMKN